MAEPLLHWDELDFGSNVFRNTPGVIVANGRQQVFLERAGGSGQLLLTMDVYDVDEGGNVQHVAKLRRNAWAFNQGDRYAVTTHPSSLTLTDSTTGTLVVEANVTGPSRVAVPRARFYTPDGKTMVEVQPSGVTLHPMQIQMSRNTFVNCQRGIIIDPHGIGLGG